MQKLRLSPVVSYSPEGILAVKAWGHTALLVSGSYALWPCVQPAAYLRIS